MPIVANPGGWAGSYITKFSVGSDGRLTFVSKTDSNYPTILNRDPQDTRVLIPWDDHVVFAKQLAVDPKTITTPIASFPSPIYSISPRAEIALTASAIYNVKSGLKRMDLPVSAPVQAVTSDYARLVYFDSAAKALKTVDLAPLNGDLNRTLQPGDGSIVLAPSALEWNATPGIDLYDLYDVYLGTSAESVASAGLGSPLYLGTVTGTSLALQKSLTPGVTYYWRVDAVTSQATSPGVVHSFTVSQLGSSVTAINAATVRGHDSYQTGIGITGATGATWTVSADAAWVTFTTDRGPVPSGIKVNLDASQLSVGLHTAKITVTDGTKPAFQIPVTLRVEPLALTILKTDPGSTLVYGISENTADATARAYLLEIDTRTEKITRVADAGTSATDLAIHHQDNAVYVPNWRTGALLAIDLTNFQQRRSYAFKPAGATGYGEDDVYRVSAGAAGRVVVEEEDQWIDASVFNTISGAYLGKTSVREGGGGFDPTGRYYYHGDNNSSGSEIHKFDTAGDVFAELAHVRVESVSYYGSRTVVVSEDGSRIFWNGSVLDAGLTEQWKIGDEIFSTSSNGTYALSQLKIYNTARKKQVLGMPISTKVSAINSTTGKIVVQIDGRPAFFGIASPLPTPILTGAPAIGGGVTLAWTDLSLEIGFTVQYRKVGDSEWTDAPDPQPAINTTTLALKALDSGTTYEFRVKADGIESSSKWSEVIIVTTTAVTLIPPTLTTQLSGSSVYLYWSSVSGATSYAVQRRIQGEADWTTLSGVITYTGYGVDGAPTPGVTYEYRVQAFAGSSTVASAIKTVTIPPREVFLPTIPQDFASWRNSAPILLTWSDALNETGYRLARRIQGTSDWLPLATLDANVKLYLDASADGANAYDYRLTAFNSDGESESVETSKDALFVPPDPAPSPTPAPTPDSTRDTKKPTVAISGPRERTTRRPTMTLFGVASDNRKLDRVEFAYGTSDDFRKVIGKQRWSVTARLKPGRNEIRVRARDASDNLSDIERVVIYRRN